MSHCKRPAKPCDTLKYLRLHAREDNLSISATTADLSLRGECCLPGRSIMATKLVRALNSHPLRLAHLFSRKEIAEMPRDPLQSATPVLRGAEIACVYYGQRMAGDFYEFLRVSPTRVLFVLLDIAGRRENTREVLIAAQDAFRNAASKLFSRGDFNETVAMTELCGVLNRTILQVAGVRSCPAVLGCYNEELGTVCYANAGHPPALLRDAQGIASLPATGLPFGLFTHAPHSASTCHLVPGAVLLLISRGVLEAEGDEEEFGLEGAQEALRQSTASSARDVCLDILYSVQRFMNRPPTHNDLTAMSLLRCAG